MTLQASRRRHGSMTGMTVTGPLPVIGYVRSRYTQTESTPIQAQLNAAAEATVEIAAEYAEGLHGLEGFDYAWLLTWLHWPREDAGPAQLRHVPFLLRRQRRQMGIFATRGPRRVNSIGLSLVRLIAVGGQVIRFAGVDVIDSTPVLDIKPYVARFDRPPGEPRCGWFDSIDIGDGLTPGSLAPPPPEASG
jgi:tRNA-Thr(GGU) m(6)t(6)A37 methyltransferase TsaA